MKFTLVSRTEWGAEEPISQTEFPYCPSDVQFCFSKVSACSTPEKCIKSVKKLQTKHMKKGFPDIAYNFLIGGDHRVYEGRGWKVQPENTEKVLDGGLPDERAILVAYIGSFEENMKNLDMTDVAHELVSYGFENRLLHGQLAPGSPMDPGMFSI